MPSPSSAHGGFSGGTVAGGVTIAPPSAATTALEVQAPAGSAAAQRDEIRVFDDNGDEIFYVDAAGNLYVTSSILAPGTTIIELDAPGGRLQSNAALIDLNAGQSRIRITSPATIYSGTTPPPYAALSAGDWSFRLNPTAAATTLEIIAKDENGTVKTTAIPLT